MQTLFDYILKLSVSLAIVYLFYQLVLRKLTFYTWNRWYLSGYTAFAFLIPLMDITKTLDKNQWNRSVILQYIPVIEVNEGATATVITERTWTSFDWLFLLLLAGMLVLIVKFAIRYLSFLKVRRNATLLADGDTKLYMVDEDIIPFSFGNNIFINNQLQDEAELKEIIRHEFVHVKQKHTHDIIWSELLCMLNWYNPFVWLIRKAIRQNLEFIADNKVLEQGYDKKKYQYLLLKVIGNNHFSIANQFNFSSLKKRITMMNKMKSARAQLIKFLFIVPLIAVMLLAFRNERNSNNNHYGKVQSDFTDTLPDMPPPPPPPPPAAPDMPPGPPAPPKLPENVKSLTMTDDGTTVVLKDGTVEKYDFKKEEDKKAFHKKYGKILAPPPPPPAPGHGVSIAPGTVMDGDNVNELAPAHGVTLAVGANINAPVAMVGNAKTITGVTAPVHTGANVYGVATANGVSAATPIHTAVDVHENITATVAPVHAVNVQGLVATGTTFPVGVNVPAAVTVGGLAKVAVAGHVVSPAGIDGEKILNLKIYNTTTREHLNKMLDEAKAKDVKLEFDEIKFEGNKLVRLAGLLAKRNSKTEFIITDFEAIVLQVTKAEEGKYLCSVYGINEKELQ